MTKNEPLEPDKYYHIYNHAVGKENLFIQPENYLFFLKRYAYYLNPVVDTFAYCLMPNHFHLAVRIKPENELIAYFELVGNLKKNQNLKFQNLSGLQNLSGFQNLRGFMRGLQNLSGYKNLRGFLKALKEKT